MSPAILLRTYNELFGSDPVVARAPGSINLMGAHTDYHEGNVLPAAIDKAVYVAAGRRSDAQIMLFSVQDNEQVIAGLYDIQPATGGWSNHIHAVVHVLCQRGYTVSGFDAVIYSEVPQGAGASAALGCAVVLALNEIFELGLSRWNMVLTAQAAQHVFSGVPCGVTDMFASIFGRRGHVIKLDCRASVHEYVPLDLEHHTILLFDLHTAHSCADRTYNERMAECAAGLQLVRERHPHVLNLRDATLPMLQQCIPDEAIRRRCTYVVKENTRLLAACCYLKIGDIAAFGQKLLQAHHGLSKDYEVSCRELDYLVNVVKNIPGVAGARMMGASFTGCMICLVEKQLVDTISSVVQDHYQRCAGKKPDIHVVETADGAALVSAGSMVNVS